MSLDAGVTWKACGEPAPSAAWYGLAFDNGRTDGMTALAATSTGLFRSTDGCRSWIKAIGLHGAADSDTVSIVLFHPTHAGEAFAAQGGKVFRSTDQGQHWSPVDDEGRGYSWPSSLFILPEAPDRIFALFPDGECYPTALSRTPERLPCTASLQSWVPGEGVARFE